MKILLIGEFSAFFKNLKIGFLSLGNEVTLMAGEDSWKKIDGADISINSKLPGFFGKISRRIQYLYNVIFLSKYDVILIVNPNIGLSFISKLFSILLKSKGSKIFLSACGTDVEYLNYGLSKKFDYWPYDDCSESPTRPMNVHKNIVNIVDFIIPTFYDYAEPWRSSSYKNKVLRTIPLCIDTKKINTYYPFSENNKKIVFFHGINRECFKGTKYIKEALFKMKEKYPNDIEVIIDGQMPLKDYLELMKRVDVVIDQCKVYSYGSMNSLYALSMGKVLMGGLRTECIVEYNMKNVSSGIIHIEPDVNQISQQIEILISNKEKLKNMGEQNRKFVELNHDSNIIAKQYIQLFEELKI